MDCARHLGVLGDRDLAGGQAAIGVAQQVGFPGPRLAWIVGGEGGEQVKTPRTWAQGGRSSAPCAGFRSVAGGAGSRSR